MLKVIIESPFKATKTSTDAEHIEYAQLCMRDSLNRGEAPFASHLLYTQSNVLDDSIPEQRELGINAGFAWRDVADLTAFYIDFGWSEGMKKGLEDCTDKGKPYEIRRLNR